MNENVMKNFYKVVKLWEEKKSHRVQLWGFFRQFYWNFGNFLIKLDLKSQKFNKTKPKSEKIFLKFLKNVQENENSSKISLFLLKKCARFMDFFPADTFNYDGNIHMTCRQCSNRKCKKKNLALNSRSAWLKNFCSLLLRMCKIHFFFCGSWMKENLCMCKRLNHMCLM